MRSLFNPESKVLLLFTKIAYSAYLNVLWLLCCLPVVTAGASTTALFYVTLKMAKDEEGNITKSFFRAFRQNFRKATLLWLILLAGGIVLALDGYVFYHMRFENVFWTIGTAIFLVALAAYAIILMYVFPLLARFENTVRAMLLNSLMLGMRFLFCTAAMAAVYFLMAFVVINIFTPAIVFGEGLCALLCSYLLSNILLLCEERAQKDEAGATQAQAAKPWGKRLSAALHDESLGTLRGRKRAQHILAYYKFPLTILCLLLCLGGYNVYRHFTHKDVLLYTALVNVTAGDTLTGQLGEEFTAYLQADASKYQLQLYMGLYLTDDELNEWHEYTYASRMKILAAIEGKTMDVVLMNREAFDAFSQNGYLLDLNEFLSAEAPALYQSLKPALADNIVILEDNGADMAQDPSAPYAAVTEERPFGLDLSEAALIEQAGFQDTVYLGVIANTPRKDMVIAYLRYLTGAGEEAPEGLTLRKAPPAFIPEQAAALPLR